MKALAACPICGSPTGGARTVLDTKVSITGAGFHSRLVECRHCSHVFLNPQPTWEELEPFYVEGYTSYEPADEERLRLELQVTDVPGGKEVSHIPVVPGGRFLDIGCGVGKVVGAMASFGMDAEGVEPSRFAAEAAHKVGRKVFCGTLEEAGFPEETFDSMSMIHVFEHLAEPLQTLRLCHRILKPGGTLTIGVPNFDSLVYRVVSTSWVGLQLPTHLHHFRVRSLEDAGRRCGFHIEKTFTESLVPFVESELVKWLRSTFYIPARLLLRSGVVRPIASYLSARGNARGGGEAIVIRLRKTAPRAADASTSSDVSVELDRSAATTGDVRM
jgi:predicted SAM-dependent methyltransferase